MADEAEEGTEEGGELEGAQFVPEVAAKAKPDVFTTLLILAFAAFFVGTILASNELHDFYDVQFWVLSKK